METKIEELRGFLEDLKVRNNNIVESDFAKRMSAEKLIRELNE